MKVLLQCEQPAEQRVNGTLEQQEATPAQLEVLNLHVTTFIKANPGKCLIGAIATGYIIGRIARRR